MLNGHAYRRRLWAPVTGVTGGGVLPTPTAVQGRNATSGRKPGSRHHAGITLNDWIWLTHGKARLPTPTARDHKGTGRDGQLPTVLTPTGAATYLNPSFVEEMMGFPVGWTVSEP
jgi:hypothetical protein